MVAIPWRPRRLRVNSGQSERGFDFSIQMKLFAATGCERAATTTHSCVVLAAATKPYASKVSKMRHSPILQYAAATKPRRGFRGVAWISVALVPLVVLDWRYLSPFFDWKRASEWAIPLVGFSLGVVAILLSRYRSPVAWIGTILNLSILSFVIFIDFFFKT